MPDSFTPDVGQQVDAEGNVTYDFDGHVHARGIDLGVVPNQLDPPPDQRVRWLNDDGSVAAQIFTYAAGPDRTLVLQAGTASISMHSHTGTGALIEIQVGDTAIAIGEDFFTYDGDDVATE